MTTKSVPHLIARECFVDPHVFQQVHGLRQDAHLVPVGGEVGGEEDVPQTAHVGQQALGPQAVRLQSLLHSLLCSEHILQLESQFVQPELSHSMHIYSGITS